MHARVVLVALIIAGCGGPRSSMPQYGPSGFPPDVMVRVIAEWDNQHNIGMRVGEPPCTEEAPGVCDSKCSDGNAWACTISADAMQARAEDAQRTVSKYRSGCNQGDPDACAELAIRALDAGQDFEGLGWFGSVYVPSALVLTCRYGASRACQRADHVASLTDQLQSADLAEEMRCRLDHPATARCDELLAANPPKEFLGVIVPDLGDEPPDDATPPTVELLTRAECRMMYQKVCQTLYLLARMDGQQATTVEQDCMNEYDAEGTLDGCEQDPCAPTEKQCIDAANWVAEDVEACQQTANACRTGS